MLRKGLEMVLWTICQTEIMNHEDPLSCRSKPLIPDKKTLHRYAVLVYRDSPILATLPESEGNPLS